MSSPASSPKHSRHYVVRWLEYHKDPVTLHSGGRSHWLVRGDLIFADENLRELVLDCWERTLETWSPPFTIVPVPTGGDVWAAALLKRLGGLRARPDSFHYRVIVDDV